MLLNEYCVKHSELNKLFGFEYTQYINDFQKQEEYYFLNTKENIFCVNDFNISCGLEDIDEELLHSYKLGTRLANTNKIRIYFNYQLFEYMSMSMDEPRMHENHLEFKLEHIKQIKNLLTVIE